jgi:PAS domain S-box-containing protein
MVCNILFQHFFNLMIIIIESHLNGIKFIYFSKLKIWITIGDSTIRYPNKRSLNGIMYARLEQFQAINPNPVLSALKDGTVLYSNKAGEPLLHEWGMVVGEKLPSSIRELVRRVISLNSPEKIEVKVGKGVYLVVFHPLPEEERVNISGFDISDQKELEAKLRESENKYRNIVKTSVEGIWIFNSVSETTYVNEKMAEMLGYNPEEIIGRFIWDFAYEEDKGIFQVKLANRKQGIDEVYELKLLRKDGSPLWVSVSAKGFFDDAGEFAGSVGMFTDITDRKRTEETLAFERSQLLSIFDGIDDVVYVTDPYTYEVLYANKAMKEKFGGELVGGICYREFQRRDSPCDFCTNQLILKEKDKPYHWEYYNPTVNRFFMIMDRIIKWPDGRDVRFEIAKDITERKEAEDALKNAYDTLEEKVKERTSELEKAFNLLKESEKGLADAQKMAHIGNWDWNLVTGELFWSDEVYRIFGLNPQEFRITYDSFLYYVHPDDRDYLINAIQEGLKGSPCAVDCRIIMDYGEERIVHIEAEVIFYEDNTPVQAKGIVQDITERKKAEEKLRKSEQKYRNIIETANEGIGIIDREGIITFSNKNLWDMFDYNIEESYDKSAYDLFEDADAFKRNQEERFKGINDTYELKAVRKDGSKLWVLASVKPLFDKKGKYTGSLGMFTDITKRKEAEDALANIEIARKKEIHHRIKNNLQVISSLLDLQSEMFRNRECVEEAEVLKAFRESQNRVMSIALIHEELHEGRGTDTLNFSTYLERLVKNLFQTYRLGNANTSLNIELEENIFFDMDIAVPLGIIINELVSNSLKYAFPGKEEGEIQIKLCRENLTEYADNKSESEKEGYNNTNFILKVFDNGIGIPEGFNTEDSGSLGLQLVTILVDQLDGELELKRNNGTEFIIRFAVSENNQAMTPNN